MLAISGRVDGIAVHGGTIQQQTLRRLAAEVPVVVLAGKPLDGIAAGTGRQQHEWRS